MSHKAVVLFALLTLSMRIDAALIAGPERLVSRAAYGPAYGSQQLNALATDGEDFLTIWTDYTPGREGIYAALLGNDGTTRPFPPRPLIRGENAYTLRAVWTGASYLLIWTNAGVMMTARVTRDGQLASQPTMLANGVTLHEAVWNGQHTLVVLQRGAELRAMFLDADDNVMREESVIASLGPGYAVAAAAAGDSFLVFWSKTVYATQFTSAETTVRAVRIRDDGETSPELAIGQTMKTAVQTMSAASDGNRIALAFVAMPQLRSFIVDPQTLAVTALPPRDVYGDQARVVAAPQGFVAGVLQYGGTLTLTTFPLEQGSPRNISLGSEKHGWDLLMSANGNAVAAIWNDYRLSPPNEYSNGHSFGITLDAAAATPRSKVVPIAVSAVAQQDADIAAAGDVALVTWTDWNGSAPAKRLATRVDRQGKVLDAHPLDLGAPDSQSVFTGSIWLVSTAATLHRIARDGTHLGTQPIALDGPMASNGRVTVQAGWTSDGIAVMRYSREGDELDAWPVVVGGKGYGAVIATNGEEFLLAWMEGSNWWQMPSANWRDIHAIRLDAKGDPLDVVPIDVAVGPHDEGEPAIASNGGDFVVLYQQIDDYTWNTRTKRVARNGSLSGTTATQDGALIGEGHFPLAITARGSGYVASFTGPRLILAAPLNAAGVATDVPQVIAQSESDLYSRHALASDGDLVWFAYARSASQPAFDHVPRVFVRTLGGDARQRAVRH